MCIRDRSCDGRAARNLTPSIHPPARSSQEDAAPHRATHGDASKGTCQSRAWKGVAISGRRNHGLSTPSTGTCPWTRPREWQEAVLRLPAMIGPAEESKVSNSWRRGRRRIDPGLSSGSIVGWVGISGLPCVGWPEIPGHPSRKRPRLRRPEFDTFESSAGPCPSTVLPPASAWGARVLR